MIRKFFTIIAVTAILTSCGNAGKKEATSKNTIAGDAAKVEFASLIENPENFINKKISVEGKVVHVCMQSGKKLFITGENPDIRLYVQAGEEMPKFPTELLGSEIVVEGTLTKIAGVPGGEGMDMAEGGKKQVSSDTCETEAALAKQSTLADLMMIYNKHTIK
ncbi:MAG: hypothetical protein MUO72_18860 [Bacteroidales bacterium]|nr:hypothetical protein [Bacteroidales bacterium]